MGPALKQDSPTEEAPDAYPPSNTAWLDLGDTEWGIQIWNGAAKTTENGQTFSTVDPIYISKSNQVVDYDGEDYTPKGSIGGIGTYAVVTVTDVARYWYKNKNGTWVEIGTSAWVNSWPTVKSSLANPSLTALSANIEINGTVLSVTQENVSTVASNINTLAIDGVTAANVDGFLEIYSDGTSSGADDSSLGGPIVIGGDATKLAELGLAAGTYYPPALQISRHVSVPEWKTADTYSRPTGSVWLKTSTPSRGMNISLKFWNSSTLLWDERETLAYNNNAEIIKAIDPTGGGLNIDVGVTYAKVNVDDLTPGRANFRIYERNVKGATVITSEALAEQTPGGSRDGTFTFTMTATEENQDTYDSPAIVSVTTTGSKSGDADAIAEAINSAGVANVSAEVTDLFEIKIIHELGGEIKFVDTDGFLTIIGFTPYVSTNPVSTVNLDYVDGTDENTSPKQYQATNWRPLTYTASAEAPFAIAAQGQLWYSSVIDEVDLLYHDGTNWKGYRNSFPNTDPNGPQVRFSIPETQSDGSPLEDGDIWVSTADLDNYPLIYVYDSTIPGTLEQKWGNPRDITDQSSEDGVLFDDARYGTDGGTLDPLVAPSGSIKELLLSDYLDPDAPDPVLYPKGMLLWNLRRSGFNVRRFERNYIDLNDDNDRYIDQDMSNYYPHRWVTDSANKENGAGNFGRFAQRKVIVTGLQAAMNSNEQIRDDEVYDFNLLATPGYPELNNEMISLNFDRNLTSFIVADTPFRLSSDTPSLQNYALNVANSPQDDEFGILSRDEYMGVYYPSGFTSDNFGNDVVVPPSHMMLRTISLSDQVSFPWFAPAGTRRGGISNASSTGYITSEGEFLPVTLNNGQRDTLYENNINPITFISGSGLVAFGQKTRARNASALDRINVARLIIYMRKQLKKLAKPYLFEPNDKITRDEIKASCESLLLELVGNRALYDFLVVCDETNNTPSRIDRNELYIDIAIEPVKAIEFIYIPLRIKNTGEIANL